MNIKRHVTARGEKIYAIIVSIFFLLFYVYFQSSSIYGGDAGDLVAAAFLRGVPHPPGYPLYTFLGWLLSHLPISTVAWRVTLLSSIPSALTLGILFLIISRLTKRIGASFIAVTTLGFTYLFWLYASVPEVFALHSFFVVLIFYLLLKFAEGKNALWFLAACFVFGLSLTHHHLITFMLPAYIYLAYPTLKNIEQKWKFFPASLALVFIGVLPYLYVVFAARMQPAINWENPVTINGFVRLVTRAMYGTFRSNQSIGLNPMDRYLAIKIAAETVLIDFTLVGLLLIVCGVVVQFLKQRRFFYATLIAFLLTGPVFAFYAGFPVLQNFTLATSERFLLVPYLFICIWMAYGIVFIVDTINVLLKRVAPHVKISSIIILGLLPVAFLIANFPKMLPLKNDQTSELLAQDILKTAPDHSVLFLYTDIPLFNTQYFYYTKGGRKNWRDIKIVHTGMLGADFYQSVLKSQYPDLDFSGIWNDRTKESVTVVADKYIDSFPIVSDTALPVDSNKYGWVPQGLLYRLYKITSNLNPLSKEEYISIVEPLFANYQNPSQGALREYTHVMLAAALHVYAVKYSDAGKVLFSLGEYETAEKYFRTALDYVPQLYEIELPLVETLMAQKKCKEAEGILRSHIGVIYNDPYPYQLFVRLYKTCFNDEQKAKEYEDLFNEKTKGIQTQLKNY